MPGTTSSAGHIAVKLITRQKSLPSGAYIPVVESMDSTLNHCQLCDLLSDTGSAMTALTGEGS